VALNDFVPTGVQGTLTLIDGTGSPVSLVVPHCLADVALSGVEGGKLNSVVDFESRGEYISSAHGGRIYPELSWSCHFVGEAAAAAGSAQAFLTRNTPYTANVSTLGSGTSRVYGVTARWAVEMSDFGGTDWSTDFLKCVPKGITLTESMDGYKLSFTLSIKGGSTGSLVLSEV